MHLSEFKAWFEGFTEDMAGPPNKAQWAKIRKRVGEITADYTPVPYFVKEYVYPYRRYWHDAPYWTCTSNNASQATYLGASNDAQKYLSTNDWQNAGRAEYSASV